MRCINLRYFYRPLTSSFHSIFFIFHNYFSKSLGNLFTLGLKHNNNDNNNNNNNNQDNVYGAVIMAEPLREFTRFV